MRLFAELYEQLDRTNASKEKQRILTDYFKEVDPEDALWTIALFSGRKPKRNVSTSQLKVWGAREAGLPDWLFELTYHTIGDLAECLALILPKQLSNNAKSLNAWMFELDGLRSANQDEKESYILNAWKCLSPSEIFVFNKLITGGFRVGLSTGILVKALTKFTGLEEAAIKYCLSGNWSPFDTTIGQLFNLETQKEEPSKPYPMCLAFPIETDFLNTANAEQFAAELKWDGIRAQVIFRKNQVFIWSRGEEIITHHFPEIMNAALQLTKSMVLDGELIIRKNETTGSFLELQKRINTQKPSQKLLLQFPVTFIAFDLLELEEKDLRDTPWSYRNRLLKEQALHFPDKILINEVRVHNDWGKLQNWRNDARAQGAEGLMLKKLDSLYGSGRIRGHWWKWKLDPYTADMVLLYAMSGHGRRSNLYTDYTFAVKDGDKLIPVAKAYSGLTDAEIIEIDHWIKANTIERFGPVRSVKAALVFEIAFEGINLSNRHKAGIALRFPRILRIRKDKSLHEIDSLEELKNMLKN